MTSNVKYSALRSAISTEKSRSRSSSLSEPAFGVPKNSTKSKKGSKRHETACDRCGHPAPPEPELPKTPKCKSKSLREIDRCEFRIRTDFKIHGLGAVPILKGDPKWLPVSVQVFVAEKAKLMKPAAIFICNGSVFEAEEMIKSLKDQGVLQSLSAYTNVHLIRTSPADTARFEKATFISHEDPNVVVPGQAKNHTLVQYISGAKLGQELDARFVNCMRGRVMYVIPFSMGTIGGSDSMNAVQLTDSPYVVLTMRMLTRVCASVWDSIGASANFARLVHSVGLPRPNFAKVTCNWLCNVERVFVAHRLEALEAWSFGSGYGGNSLLGKKALSLRLAAFRGLQQGWLAEHAALLSITDPSGKEFFITLHAPSGGGKTAFALAEPGLPNWKVKVLGDDIVWLRRDEHGRVIGTAPECGMFGVIPGLDPKKHPAAFKMLAKNALLVNAASTNNGRFFWRGVEQEPNEIVNDWLNMPWNSAVSNSPAHPNARFTAFTQNCPTAHPDWDSPKGVPVSAMVFCSRRSDAYPLCLEASDWSAGVALAAGMRCEQSAGSGRASDGAGLVHDPMGMRPFLAYNFAHYLQHWLDFGAKAGQRPKIFLVNWFRAADGKPIWPGFGENIRVVEWILSRCAIPKEGATTNATSPDASNSVEVTLGYTPKTLNLTNLDAKLAESVPALLAFEKSFWKEEIGLIKATLDAELGPAGTPQTIAETLSKWITALA